MCGLTGVWRAAGAPADTLEATAMHMADAICHRGPDDAGVWTDPAVGIALGFRRLAILDLTPAGHQPMMSPDGQWVLAFNGEIYNFRELRAELAVDGARFRGGSDTEVVLECVRRRGFVATCERLWGMFALAAWDAGSRTLWLARDRMGEKPLYFGIVGDQFVFGSELKALRASGAGPWRVDPEALALYLRHGYVPGPWSIYAGVRKLAPGGYAAVRDGRVVEEGAYWDVVRVARARSAQPTTTDAIEAGAELEALLGDAVARRMVADVPLGAFLSGGVDSSTVVALMQARASVPVQTFCVGFDSAAFNEADAARAVAAHLGTEHHELRVTPADALALVPRMAEVYDEPFADSSQIPTYLVSEFARRRVTVALSGDGGDELFYGYGTYVWADALRRWRRRVPRPFRHLTAGAARTARAHASFASPARWRGLVERATRAAELLAAPDDEALYLGLVSAWRGRAPVLGGGTAPETAWTDGAARAAWATFAQRIVLADLRTYLPDDILVKLDRATMATGLEGRTPLLDHRVVEWSWRLPHALKQRDGRGKWLLREVLYRHVPRTLVDRPKRGFAVPIAEWLAGPLRPWAEALLASDALLGRGLVDPGPVRAAWVRLLAGERALAREVWSVLMLHAWADHWL